jgi:GNAT superfamily N-acetyltransferase
VLARLAAGERCFVAWRDERIVSDAWAVSKRTVLLQHGVEVHIAADQIWLADSWVLPELRGRNIATQRGAMMTERLTAEGYTRAVYHVSARDRSALGPPRKLGARCLGSFGYLRLGPLRLDFEHMHGHRVRWMRSLRQPRVITLT